MKRRNAIHLMGAIGFGTALPVCAIPHKELRTEFHIQQLTRAPEQHWFGYYDKWQIDPANRYALANEVPADIFRSPNPNDVLKIGVIDLHDNRWTTIGKSSAWGWQQGCMLQWLPGSANEIIWNARLDDEFVSIIQNVITGKQRILPKPIYTLSPDGSFGLGIDFARLQTYRPGYGYATSISAPTPKAPDDTGIYKIDLTTGVAKLILSYAEVAELERPLGSVKENHHWINHLLINPSGDRFIFLNRSRPYRTWKEWERSGGANRLVDEKYITRAITATTEGKGIYPLNDSGDFSHFIWKGDNEICAWAKPENINKAAFYLFKDQSKTYKVVGEDIMTLNGHNTYVPNTNYQWILNDTYPSGGSRLQELYLYHIPTNRKVVLGEFYEPVDFKDEWRCDLHPRCNQQGTKVFFDSTHVGKKRQLFSVEIGHIVNP